jgi:probable rRNA maturation factor
MTQNNADVSQHLVEEDEDAPDDPEPHLLTLLIQHDAWHALGDVREAIHNAYDGTKAKVNAIAGREVAVVLASDEDVQTLNREFRGKNAPTNVLSFPTNTGSSVILDEAMPLGDIILAYETVTKEASNENKSRLHHLTHLVIHGLLHLTGFDHQRETEAAQMEALECEILASLSIADPYSPLQGGQPLLACGCAHE